jgi:hypothetical protein
MVGWLRKIFGRTENDSVLSSANRQLLQKYRRSTQESLSILQQCQTRQQVIEGFSKIGQTDSDVSVIAANISIELQRDPGLDAFRFRDDFIRRLEAFLSSTRNM